MLDADSVIEPGFFAACERAMGSGAGAIQARSESSHGRSLAIVAAAAVGVYLIVKGLVQLIG